MGVMACTCVVDDPARTPGPDGSPSLHDTGMLDTVHEDI